MPSVSFANVVPLGGTGTGTATATAHSRQTAHLDDDTILGYFTKPYLLAHELSWPSFRYAAYFWFLAAAALVLGSIWHVMTRRGGGALGASVNKLAMQQVVWDRQRRSAPGKIATHASTSLGQAVAIVVLFVITFCLCYVGVDYVDPRTCLFGGTCPAAASAAPPKTTFASRAYFPEQPPVVTPPSFNKLFPRGDLNAGGWAPYMDPLLSGPSTEIDKNLWTSSSRMGMITYAMYPLTVALGLKAWPFNIFATPWLTDWAYNKSSYFHRWFGRIVFILSTLHVVLWTVQLFRDQDPYGKATFFVVWKYWRFQAGVAAYAAVCAMALMSLHPLRKRFYEITYYMHAALAVALLVGSALHYKYLAPYCYIALGLWGGERVFRWAHWLFINGSPFKKLVLRPAAGAGPSSLFNEKQDQRLTWDSHTYESAYDSPEVASYFEGDDEQRRWSVPASPSLAGGGSAVESPLTAKQLEKSRAFDWPDIPAGYALAQILPGKTIRLQLHVPRRLYWRTGQHVSLTIPAVRFWQGHPFTICVADDRITHRSAEFKDGGCYLQILARVKGGFTKALWNKLHSLTEASPAPVLLRAQVGWPLGSNKGARIQDFSTVIVLCGGSGISFGVGVFEHACHALAGRVGKNSKVQRIKLIWLLREFAHITWVAPQVHQALKLWSGTAEISVEFFVTADAPKPAPSSPGLPYDNPEAAQSTLEPPRPGFLPSQPSKQSFESIDMAPEDHQRQHHLAVPSNPEDQTGLSDVEFEGEEEGLSHTEQKLGQQLRKTGKIRRANSRAAKEKARLHLPRPESRSTINTNYDYPPSIAPESRPSSPHPSPFLAAIDRSASRGSIASTLNLPYKLSTEEEDAVNALAEVTMAGKPDLLHMLQEEVACSAGKVLVAACGPPSLNTKVRKWTSQLISPGKIWRGDQSGQVELFLEEYA